ncbi:S-layer homology domain-containing protein [Ruminococcus sp.]|uniref:S-layer homology domain-containing protein n=1 Tax=Ruminococcus sp. TaxID=41978 RepID=UPI0025F1FA4E|nr:S-layer homology domain-containing protein [Ruminococcus sp.]MBR1431518.1 S-layer homology domain-containing protein [Ruminococcus sp.]
MKRLACIILSAILTLSALPQAAYAANIKFSDVTESHWAYSTIMDMTAKGFFNGTSEPVNGVGTFSPSSTMSRAEFITVAMRVMYQNEAASVKPTDSSWWSGYYRLAVNKGILLRSELDSGKLDKAMTRQEMAMILVRCVEKNEALTNRVSTSQIADYSSVGSYYKDFVLDCFSFGLLCGVDDKGTFMPSATLDRAQGATVLCRLIDKDKRINVSFGAYDIENTAVLATPSIALTVPGEFYANTVREIIDDDPYTLLFSSKKDGTKLFSLVFNGRGDTLLGTVIGEKKNTVIYVNTYPLDSKSRNYEENSAYQKNLNDIVNAIASDYRYLAGEEIYSASSEVVDIQTPYFTFRVPESFDENVSHEITNKDPFTILFRSMKDNARLFSLVINGKGETLIGTVVTHEGNYVIYADFYRLNENSKYFSDNAAYQEMINYIIDNLSRDYQFYNNQIVGKDDDGTFDIETSVLTLKYPSRWKGKVETEVTNNGVKFLNQGTPLFEIMFTDNGGYFLGNYNGTTLYFASYPVTAEEQIEMKEDASVTLQYIMNDKNFASGR